MSLLASYHCSNCGRELEQGEFMALIGTTPPSGLSTPLARTDVIMDNIGKTYCDACFEERYEPRKTALRSET